jgi:hypothetical protein
VPTASAESINKDKIQTLEKPNSQRTRWRNYQQVRNKIRKKFLQKRVDESAENAQL